MAHQTISFLSAPAGAGKTHAIIEHCADLVQSGKFILLVQPTLGLIAASVARLKAAHPQVMVTPIHGGDDESSVVGRVISHLKSPGANAHVLAITWSAFERLPFIPSPGAWHLIVDEVPPVHRLFSEVLPITHGLLTNHLEPHPDDGLHARLIVRNPARIRAIAENRTGDRVLRVFEDLPRRLNSQNWRHYVRADQYGGLISNRGGDRKLQVYSVLQPSLVTSFASTLIVGARIEETLLFKLWSLQGIRFDKARHLKAKLLFDGHENGDLVAIHYGVERPWSKSLMKKNGGEALSNLADGVKRVMSDDRFLYLANKSTKDSLLGFGPNSIRLPNTPHGLNEFQEVDNVAILSALNLQSCEFAFLHSRGIEQAAVKTAIFGHAVYQAVLRSSIRNPSNRSPKQVIVPDREIADWLSTTMPGSNVTSLGLGFGGKPPKCGRPQVHSSSYDRKQAYRDRKHASTSQGEACDETHIQQTNDNEPRLHGTLWEHLTSTSPCRLIDDLTIEEFIAFLRESFRREIGSTAENQLFCPATFDAATDIAGRGTVRVAYGLWLDNVGGDLPARSFPTLFPKLRCVTFDTYESARAAPRWRVYIPLVRPVTEDEYREICGKIVGTVEESGYPLSNMDSSRPHVKAHGFDLSAFHPSSLFYLPCQHGSRCRRDFRDFRTGRVPLDPDEWLLSTATTPAATRSPLPPPADNDSGAVIESSSGPLCMTGGKRT